MSELGTIQSIHRYPVKSMRGESLSQSYLGPQGIPGDRAWALKDEVAGEIRGGKKFPALMLCEARYTGSDEPGPGTSPVAEITLPDGSRFASDAADAGERLTGLVGKKVSLWPLVAPGAEEADAHYRRGTPDNEDFEQEMRQVFGRLPDEPLPDLTTFDPELFEFVSPRGTYFDALPLHLLTTSTLAHFSNLNPGSQFGVDRFRPNFVVDTGQAGGTVEADWAGRILTIGAAKIEIVMPTVRCSMITQPTGEFPKDPKVLRSVVQDGGQSLGVYARVVAPGLVEVGDAISLD